MKNWKKLVVLGFFLASAMPAVAKVDLVTLPTRDSVQLTIYNSADLTLAKDSRSLTLKEGLNELQFSWANTLIDPTSLEMIPQAKGDKVSILDLTYPPRVKDLGLWNIESAMSGQLPVKISYLTSGLSWRAFYLGTLDFDEKVMQLKGYVRVTNNSGEDYENAQVRLIVGKVHMIDQIASLARRQYPYDRPGYYGGKGGSRVGSLREESDKSFMIADAMMPMVEAEEFGYDAPKEIVKQGLSEYFLYTIDGTETIPNGWSKRLPSFDVAKVDVVNLYKYEEERYGHQVIRFLSFKNDEDHNLGETPIPGGAIKVFRRVDAQNHLSYEGQSSFKYIPVDEDVELNLGAVANVVVAPKLMDYKTENYHFDRWRNIDGWEEIREFKIELKNTREVPIKIEVQRNFNTSYWKIKNVKEVGTYEKIDKDTVKYTVELKGKESQELIYVLRTFHGKRQDKMK